LFAAIEIEHDNGDVFDLRVDGVAEDDRLNDRNDQHENKRRGLAGQVVKLFDEDGEETGEGTPIVAWGFLSGVRGGLPAR